MKKNLIIGFLLLFICLGLVIYNEIKVNKINNSLVNIYGITNKGKKDEDVLVYLDTTFIAGNIMDEYYVFFGDGVQYIVKIDNNIASRINKYLMDNPEDSYLIIGKTKLIPNTLEEPGKAFVKKWLDTNHAHHDEEDENHTHEITTEEFYQYFGHVYLDYSSDVYNNILVKVFIYITGIIGGLFVLKVIIKKYNFL